MKLTFYGGAGSVTGANYMLESGDTKILIDCGLMQGSNYAERKNFEDFKYDPSSVEAVFITHAHIDHIGRVPKLCKDGFKGNIYSTPPTRDFAEFLLLDSEHILRQEAEKQKREPMYDVHDIQCIMGQWKGVEYHKTVKEGPFTIEFFDAGHILGSSFIKVTAEGKTVVFSGDLGNPPAPIIKDTEPLPDVDYCLIESTYGGRLHESEDTRKKELKEAILKTINSGGVLMIPAFAMERTQDLLYYLNNLIENGEIPRIPIFIDSPLAIKLTTVYKKYENYFDKKASSLVAEGDDILDFPGLRLTLTTSQSKDINNVPPPKVIIAGSGMSNGGRILHHEMRYLPDPKSCLLLVGYQAEGTLGRRIIDGAKKVRIFGEDIPVRARVKMVGSYSGHADQPKLLEWLKPRAKTLKKVYVIQGEASQSRILAKKIKDDFKLATEVPKPDQVVEL